MKRALALGAVLALGATAVFVYHHHGPREVPQGQPPLQSLEAGLSPLRRAFNEAADATRVVAMLSPT